ncbi:MAG: hypothetical protein K6E98_12735 [Lachnospiraceae bacterium]|nr:hypothetical protein [Lachnospiraceae bacterium]
MIIIEVYAVELEERIELEVDENITGLQLCECLSGIFKRKDTGILICRDPYGALREEVTLAGYGLVTGTLLIYSFVKPVKKIPGMIKRKADKGG